MIRKIALAALFLTLGSIAALAADFNGKWTAASRWQHPPVMRNDHKGDRY